MPPDPVDTLRERLLAEAEMSEKGIAFMGDPELVEETLAHVRLLREAAGALSVCRDRADRAEEILRQIEVLATDAFPLVAQIAREFLASVGAAGSGDEAT